MCIHPYWMAFFFCLFQKVSDRKLVEWCPISSSLDENGGEIMYLEGGSTA